MIVTYRRGYINQINLNILLRLTLCTDAQILRRRKQELKFVDNPSQNAVFVIEAAQQKPTIIQTGIQSRFRLAADLMADHSKFWEQNIT